MTTKKSNLTPNLVLLECNHYELTFMQSGRIGTHFPCSTCKKSIMIRRTVDNLVEQIKIKLVEQGKNVQIVLPRPTDNKKAILKQLREMQGQLGA